MFSNSGYKTQAVIVEILSATVFEKLPAAFQTLYDNRSTSDFGGIEEF